METVNSENRSDLIKWSAIYLLINTLFIILYSQKYTLSVDLPDSLSSWVFFITYSLGHYFFLAFFLYLLIFIPLSLILPVRKIFVPVTITIITTILIALIIDSYVFEQYRFHINLFYLKMIYDSGDQIIGFPALTWLILGLIISLLFFMQSYLAIKTWGHKDYLYQLIKPKPMFTVFISLYFFSQIIHIFADAYYDRSVTQLGKVYPLSFPATAKSFLTKNGLALASRPEKLIPETGTTLGYPSKEIAFSDSQDKLNILFIVIDSWRFDMLAEDITPNIYALSQNSLNFKNHFSAANSTRTGIFSLLYGLPGNYWHAFESNQVGPVLIESLLKQQYKTAVYASAPLTNPEFDRTAFIQIPDLSVKTRGNNAYERDENIINKWLAWTSQYQNTKSENTPFFGFLFLDSIHAYQYPDDYPRHFIPTSEYMNYLSLNKKTDITPIKNLYKNITHYLDSLVGKVINDLKEKKLLDSTVIIFTGDHGQELNDSKKNYWGHNSNFTKYQTQVPLVIHWPGKTAKEISERTSHYDLVPTLMNNMLGSKASPDTYSVGRDLFNISKTPLDSMIMSSYSMISILDFTNNVQMVKNASGLISYLDNQYNPVNRKPSAEAIQKAINDMSRFFKK